MDFGVSKLRMLYWLVARGFHWEQRPTMAGNWEIEFLRHWCCTITKIDITRNPQDGFRCFKSQNALLACGKGFPLRTESDNGWKLRNSISETLIMYYYENCHNSKSPWWILELQSSECSTGLWQGVSIENRGRQWLEIEKSNFWDIDDVLLQKLT